MEFRLLLNSWAGVEFLITGDAMPQPIPVSILKVAPHYAVHIVVKDNVVVLYNQKRPLILQGQDKVRLFQIMSSLPDQQISAEDLGSLPEDLVLLIAQLLQQNILECLDLDPAHEQSPQNQYV